jgi:conjugal transfer mating pair stabilization protein TraN
MSEQFSGCGVTNASRKISWKRVDMHVRRSITALILLLLSMVTQAADFQCAMDFDGDNALTSDGEIASCISTNEGPLCPLDSQQCAQDIVCPLDEDRGCIAGSCSIGGTCRFISSLANGIYECNETSQIYLGEESCRAGCIQTAQCVTSPPKCPIEGSTCKQGSDGNYSCSSQTCVDIEANPPITAEINSGIYKDDGERDGSGMCLDQIMIYSGRTMECRLAGKSTAYASCCKAFDEIMKDSTGSIREMAAVGSAISGTYAGTKAAFDVYKSTKDVSAAAEGFTNAFKTAFDPASLAITLAVSAAIEYFVNNCNEMDMETGIMNASGMCYETGQYCKSKLFGSCVQEAKTYCCFNSKLGRIIHEGGRPQLQSFVGVPETNCRGFYPEEFQYLDFSKIEMDEYYGDLPVRTQEEMEYDLGNKTSEAIELLD